MRKPASPFIGYEGPALAWLAMWILIAAGALKSGAAAIDTNGFQCIDLTPFATNSEALTGRQFSAVPKGLQSFRGVPFLIRLPMGLNGMESARAGEHFPTEVTGIKIGAAAKRLHLLHATIGPDKDGVPVAAVILNYADGTHESLRLGYGIHARDWTTPRSEKRSGLLDPNSHLAWSEGDDRSGGEIRIFQTALANPRPAEKITSIDVVSLFSQATPFIIAMSAEGPDSTLPDNVPPPSRKALREMNEFVDAVYRREFVVRVTDAETGAPVTNATASLTIMEDKEKTFWGEKHPDAQGMCRLVYPPQQTVGYTIWVHAPGRMPALVSESKTNLVKFTHEHSVVLKRGTTVGGIVKQSDGKPVSGAQVIIHRVTRVSPHHYERIDYDAATTSPDGKWTSTSLPADLSGFSFQVMHPDYAPAQYVTAGFAPPPTNTTISSSSPTAVTYRRLADGTLVPMNQPRVAVSRVSVPLITTNALLSGSAEMTLRPAILLEGTLAGPNGAPMPDVALTLLNLQSPANKRQLKTDAQGRFHARVPDPGNVVLLGVPEGFAPLYQLVNVTPSMSPVKLQLRPPQVLRGRVQDRNQRPVAGAKVRLDDWHGTTDLLRFQATTDEEGRFAWTNAPSGQVMFYVSKTNYYNTRQSFSLGTDEITLSLNQAPGVYGKVYDAETKKPIESFTVIPGRKYSPNQTQIQWERFEAVRGYNGEFALRVDSYMFQPEARVLVEAPGYQPQVSRAFTGPDSYTNDFALQKGRGISGIVLLPDGSPAANATLVLVERGQSGSLDENGQLRGSGSGDMIRSDSQGRFSFVPKLDPAKIFVSHEQGFGEASVAASNRIVLQKWGRVQGVLRVGDKVDPEQTVRLQNRWERYADENNRPTTLSFYLKADPDVDGNFLFEKVPPGEHRLSLEYRFRESRNGGETPLSHGFLVAVKAGETANATLGGTGRRVMGRVKVNGGENSDVDWKRDVHKLVLSLPPLVAPPVNLPGLSARDQQRAWNDFNNAQRNFWNTDAGRAREREERTYVLLFDTNGTFHADNIPAGKYNLSLNVTDPEEEYYSGRAIGSTNLPVVVPAENNAKLNAPLDIGVVELTIRPRIKMGRPVPSFAAKTAEGKAIKLADYRGKFVLLHFWGLSVGYSTVDLQMLKELQNTFGAGGKLAILGCNVDADQKNAAEFVTRQGMTWTQLYLGDWSQTTIPGMFGIRGNTACILIDPEGKLASGQLRSSTIRTTVANAMGAAE